MQTNLRNRVALVTGGSRGIGRAIAEGLAGEGAKVMISSRKKADLAAAAEAIEGDVSYFAANAGKPEDAAACVEATMERFGRIDILINNAATNPYFGPAIEIDLSRYDKTFDVNLRGPLVWAQEVWKASMKANGGTIVNVSSVGALAVEHGIGIYNTTKAALLHQTRTLASELAPNVRVNAVLPGLVKTDMARALWEPNEETLGATMPLGRLGEPSDIANAAVFLASDLASWVTGTTLVVDGGIMVRGSSL